mgnify:CR=1 FL=1
MSLVRTVGITMSPFTAKTKTQEFDGVYWTAEVSLPPMRREQAAEWQAFLLETNGQANYFAFGDPDSKAAQGTYNTSYLLVDRRINDTSETLSFAANGTITAATTTFSSVKAHDYIHITGAANEANNGTHKIVTYTSTSVIVTDSDLVAESNRAGCKIRQNIKGATALSLEASSNGAIGTIKKGDYLGILSSNSDSADPVHLHNNGSSAKNHISVRTQPKLRQDLTDGHYVMFQNPQGKFRLATNEVDWSANHVSNYGIGFSCIEVV